MIRIFPAISLFWVMLLSVSVVMAQTFLSVAEDVPLMAGLVEDIDASLVFDSPDGRIIEAAAVGDAKANDIRAFYTATLPQLGWSQRELGRFVRDSEVLTLEIAETEGHRLVRFRFAPNDTP